MAVVSAQLAALPVVRMDCGVPEVRPRICTV
jgi:hypothetical protein